MRCMYFSRWCVHQRRHNHRRTRTTTTTTATMAMAMVTMARVTSTRRLVVTPFARASDGGARSRHATANQNHNENHRPTVSRSNASLAGLTPPPLPSDGGSSYHSPARRHEASDNERVRWRLRGLRYFQVQGCDETESGPTDV